MTTFGQVVEVSARWLTSMFRTQGLQCPLRCLMRVVAVVVLFFVHLAHSQTNCPTPDRQAPAPTALVSSPLIRVRTNPPVSQSVLTVPNQIFVYVKTSLHPSRVELWTGPTGTEVAEFYCRLASDEHPVSVGKYKRFSFTLTSCRDVSARLEPRVYSPTQVHPYSVYEGPIECHEQRAK